MIRVIDMTEAESEDEFCFAIWDTVRSQFFIDPESKFQTWTITDWENPDFCSYDEEFKERVRRKFPTCDICGKSPHYDAGERQPCRPANLNPKVDDE